MAEPVHPQADPYERPQVVTAAAIVLFVVGALNVVSSFFLFQFGTLGVLFGIIGLAIGAAAIYAGVQIMALREQGRLLGMGVAGIGILFGIYSLIQGNVWAVIGLALNGFVIWALATNSVVFRR